MWIELSSMNARGSDKAGKLGFRGIAASPALLKTKQQLNPWVVYSPHGVDADLFGQAAGLTRLFAKPAHILRRPAVRFFEDRKRAD